MLAPILAKIVTQLLSIVKIDTLVRFVVKIRNQAHPLQGHVLWLASLRIFIYWAPFLGKKNTCSTPPLLPCKHRWSVPLPCKDKHTSPPPSPPSSRPCKDRVTCSISHKGMCAGPFPCKDRYTYPLPCEERYLDRLLLKRLMQWPTVLNNILPKILQNVKSST